MSEQRRVTQSELQQDLERFVGVFSDRVAQAAEPLVTSSSLSVRTAATRRVLLYLSSALDIATGRLPEVNLLDMLTFMMLNTAALKEVWVPELFGEAGRPLLSAFERSTRDLWEIADKVLEPAQQDRLRRVVAAWRQQNPELQRVEAVRLSGFSSVAGDIEGARAEEARGLLSTVKTATQAADQALLLAERALFLAQRMPFLLRMQARLGAQELMQEGSAMLGDTEELMRLAPELRPLLTEATTLAEQTRRAAGDLQALMSTLQPLLRSQQDHEEPLAIARLIDSGNRLVDQTRGLLGQLDRVDAVLASAQRLTERSEALLSGVQRMMPETEGDPLAAVGQQVDDLVRRWLLYLALVGAVLIVLFWTGYILARRLTRYRGPPPAVGASGRDEAGHGMSHGAPH